MPEHHTDTPRAEQAEVEYRPVSGFPGYRVGDDGSVWSCIVPGYGKQLSEEWHRLAPCSAGRDGIHCKVRLCRGGRAYHRYVHILVLEAFVGPRPDGLESCHEDGDGWNNAATNLRWGTRSSNREDSRRHGTMLLGERNPLSKLTADEVLLMRSLAADGWLYRELAVRFRVSMSLVHRIVRRQLWKHI